MCHNLIGLWHIMLESNSEEKKNVGMSSISQNDVVEHLS
jgi:hypothetical protein